MSVRFGAFGVNDLNTDAKTPAWDGVRDAIDTKPCARKNITHRQHTHATWEAKEQNETEWIDTRVMDTLLLIEASQRNPHQRTALRYKVLAGSLSSSTWRTIHAGRGLNVSAASFSAFCNSALPIPNTRDAI